MKISEMFVVACILGLIAFGVVGLRSCNSQGLTKNFGGTAKIDLPAGKKLVNVTWKGEADLWYLMRDMREGEKPEVLVFQESSQFGLMEGEVIITEHAAEKR